MSDLETGANEASRHAKAPKATVEQAPVSGLEDGAATKSGEDAAKHAGRAKRAGSFQNATMGFFQGMGQAAWSYADGHPHATLYGLVGFVLAVLILIIGLWDTIVIAVFVAVGTVIGQMVDGDNAIVNFFSGLFGKRR